MTYTWSMTIIMHVHGTIFNLLNIMRIMEN
jgi:hypothetical protein